MKYMKISSKLFASFTVVIAMVIVLGAATLYAFTLQVGRISNVYYNVTVPLDKKW